MTPGALFPVHGPSGAARGAEGCMYSLGPFIQRGLEMITGQERVLSELQSALDALTKSSEHLERASQESTASEVSPKVAGAKSLLKDLQQEVLYLMRLTQSESQGP